MPAGVGFAREGVGTRPGARLAALALVLAAGPGGAPARFAAAALRGDELVWSLSGRGDAAEPLAELRRRAASTPVVVAGQERLARVALGHDQSIPVWDALELAGLLRPRLGASDLDGVAREWGLGRAERELDDGARLLADLFAHLADELLRVDAEVLAHVNRLAAPLDWPLRQLFVEVERERVRGVLEHRDRRGGAESPAAWLRALAPPAAERRPTAGPRSRPKPLQLAEALAPFQPDGGLAAALPAYESRPQQEAMVAAVVQALSQGERVLVEAGTGTGKALDVNTDIPTPHGWKRLADIRAGDLVFDDSGQPTRVTAAFDVLYDRPCYEVAFSDGSVLVADAEHEWVTYTSRDRRWAARSRGDGYLAKHFATSGALAQMRAVLATCGQDETLSIREARERVGGHQWSLQQATRTLCVSTMTPERRYPAQSLLGEALERLERDVREQRRDGTAYTLTTTARMAQTLTVGNTGRLNHGVLLAAALQLPPAALPVDPYFLGAWLGDGKSSSSEIVSADPAVLTEIERAGYGVRPLRSHPYLYAVDDERGTARGRWQPGLTGTLRSLGLIRNKHIPAVYLRAAEQQRRALLAGLLDTDGTVSPCGGVEFSTTSRRLSEDVRELVCSLGYRAAVREDRAVLQGRDCGPAWTIQFTTRDTVFRLPRKQRAQAERTGHYSPARNRYRYVTAVRPVPSRPVRCMQVEAASHLYLAGRSFIPTHNSLAYLVTCALAARRNRWRVVVSTATTNLQDQLFEKDLPVLRAALGEAAAPRATVLKGRANYLCLRRWQTLLQAHDLDADERSLLIRTLFWLPTTASGDRAELRLTAGEAAAWQRLAALPDACTPHRCAFHRSGMCFLARARRAAQASEVVIANHALLLSDLAEGSRVLPDYQVLVVDEAHHLEDEATAQLGWRVGERELLNRLERLWGTPGGRGPSGAVAEALALLRRGGNGSAQRAAELTAELARTERAVALVNVSIRSLYAGLADLLRQDEVAVDDGTLALRVTGGLRAGSAWQQIEATWDAAARPLLDGLQLATQVQSRLEERSTGKESEPQRELAAELAGHLDFWHKTRERLEAALHVPDPATVYWLSGARRSTPWLNAAPLEVATTLQAELFAKPEAVVLVSATLAVEGSFAYVKERLGLAGASEANVGSPFDYRASTLLYVPYDIPEPTQPGYQALLESTLADAIVAAEGRTLALFTSRAHLRATYAALRPRLEASGITLLGQGIDESSRTRLLDQLRHGRRVALFGTSSFWEGIDVVGDALSCVAVARLPFSVPTDPVYSARAEQFDDPFSEYAVPQAVLRFKQGFGRLIRSRTDRGAVLVLDRRIATRPYGGVFLRSLPACSAKQGPAARTAALVREWLHPRER